MLIPPYAADQVPDVSAGMLASIAARDAAVRAGHVAVSVRLFRGGWTVEVDTMTAPGHTVPTHEARVLAEAVWRLVRAGVARSGTSGPLRYGLEHVAVVEDARALAAAMHAACYGDATVLEEVVARLCEAAEDWPGDP